MMMCVSAAAVMRDDQGWDEMDFKIRNMKHETNPSPGDDGR
jgi:hypothetical protein